MGQGIRSAARTAPHTYAVAAGSYVLAAASAALAVYQPITIPLTLGFLALARWPAAVVVALLILCQELNPESGGFGSGGSPFLTLGHQLYFTTVGPFSAIQVILAAAAAASSWHFWHKGEKTGGPWSLALILPVSAGIVISGTAFLQGASPASAVNQYGRPYLLAVLAVIVMSTVDSQPGGRGLVLRVGGFALISTALVGAYLFVTNQGANLADGNNLIFYDSALPAMAGSVLLAMLLRLGFIDVTPVSWALAVSTILIVTLSFRRNVWLAMLVVLLLALLVRRGRWRLVAVAFAGLASAWLLSYLIDRGLPGLILGRAFGWVEAVQNSSQDSSLQGHTGDIAVGLKYAIDGPFLGLGPSHGPLPGLFNQSGLLYVHNEYLFTWIRFGIPGLVASAAILGGLLFLGILHLRGSATNVSIGTSAIFMILAPLCAVTAPFFTSTSRWPVALGLAGGVLISARRADNLRARFQQTQAEVSAGD